MMPGGGGPPRGTATGVKAMTIDEITNCARRVKGLREDLTRLTAMDTRMKEQKTSIETAGKAIEAGRPRVNIKSAKQVATFNQRVEQHLESIRRFNADVADVNTWVSARGVLINDYKVFCWHRVYRASDRDLLPPDLRTALESVGAASDLPLLDEPETGFPLGRQRPAFSADRKLSRVFNLQSSTSRSAFSPSSKLDRWRHATSVPHWCLGAK